MQKALLNSVAMGREKKFWGEEEAVEGKVRKKIHQERKRRTERK